MKKGEKMLNSKKGQGLSLNTIIIAIIVLVVLVVIVMIFTGVIGTVFVPGISSCEQKGGTCDKGDDCGGSNSGYVKAIGSHCSPGGTRDQNSVCCIQAGFKA